MVYFICISSTKFDKKVFFEEISNSLNKITSNYDNVVLAGDLNINLLDQSADTENHLSDLIDIFDLKNMVKEPTCFKSEQGSLIYIIQINLGLLKKHKVL